MNSHSWISKREVNMGEFILNSLKEPSFISIFIAYLGGLLTSLTPCVYPMIPIVAGIIGASKVEKRIRSFLLASVYALGLALVYAALGVIAALTGSLFGTVASSPWSYLIFGNFSLLLSFWMMGWINPPMFTLKQKSSIPGYGGVFLSGLLSGLVVAPCTSPVMAGLLLYVSSSSNVVLGSSMLFSFSLGMSTLLIVIGTFSGLIINLPKPGKWMVRIKRGLALILFIAGQYYLLKAGGGFLL